MEIKFIGHSCFEIKNKDLTLIIDPYKPDFVGISLPKLKADVVLSTHDHNDHNNTGAVSSLNGTQLVINSPGEYEKKGVFISGIRTFHDEVSGEKRGTNTIYSIEMDDVTILHLGDLGHELSTEVLEKLPNVDILLVPVGGTYTLDADGAIDIISSIEPGIVIPMHYAENGCKIKELATLDGFLDEMGVEDNVKREDFLSLKSASDVPQETEVVILAPQH